jgi:glutathione S-transferase
MRLYDYAASANCYKVRLLLAQLGADYERVPVDIFAGETLTDEYLAKNPAAETPVLELDDGELLPESNAILLYLGEGTSFVPTRLEERAQVWRWLIYEQAALISPIGGLRFRLLTGRLAADSDDARRRHRAAQSVLGLLDGQLRERAFLVGERYSVADIGVYGYVHVAPEAGIALDPYPAVRAWLDRVAAQPGHMNDLEPYPANARPGAGRSIYD